jgi:hypothetical protein
MFGAGVSEDLSIALVNAAVLALWAMLPALSFAYVRQSLAARRMRPEFSLRKSEAVELDRAVLLYEKVCNRLRQIDARGDEAKPSWRDLYRRRAEIDQQSAEEREDLEAHAHHLRATIARLQRRPIQRLTARIHIMSAQFALGRALTAYLAGVTVLIAAFYVSEQPAQDFGAAFRDLLVWYPLDERLFYANAVAAGIVALVAPIAYLARRAKLQDEHRLELCALKEFAATDPDQVIEQSPTEEDAAEQVDTVAFAAPESWWAVLGLSPSATIEQVKDAYKELIKQNHPDRVHGMSPAFRKLAEAETKKLNAAYADALRSLRACEREPA